MNTTGHFVPYVRLLTTVTEVQSQLDLSFRLELHGLAPEFGSYPQTLEPLPAGAGGVGSRDWRVMRYLLRDKLEALVFPDTLESFSQQWIEGFMAGSGIV